MTHKELSKMEADKLGVADMTGPQLRLRVLQLEGELADYKAHAWVEMGDYIVVQRQRDALVSARFGLLHENEALRLDLASKAAELAKAWEAGRDAAADMSENWWQDGEPWVAIRALQPPGGKAK